MCWHFPPSGKNTLKRKTKVPEDEVGPPGCPPHLPSRHPSEFPALPRPLPRLGDKIEKRQTEERGRRRPAPKPQIYLNCYAYLKNRICWLSRRQHLQSSAPLSPGNRSLGPQPSPSQHTAPQPLLLVFNYLSILLSLYGCRPKGGQPPPVARSSPVGRIKKLWGSVGVDRGGSPWASVPWTRSPFSGRVG